MNIVIDVGNTTIRVGMYEKNKLSYKCSFTTDLCKTEDEYFFNIVNQFKLKGILTDNCENLIFSSVVPSLNKNLLSAFERIFSKKAILIGPGIKTGLSIKVDNPNEIGNDLIAALVGGKEKYHYPTLIIDMGTATKILLIDKNGSFVSASILPGLIISANSLTNKAALLPEIGIVVPKSIITKNTIDAMNAGITFGHASSIKGIVEQYEKEIGYSCTKVITGGNAAYILNLFNKDYIFDEDLVFEGLNFIINKNGGTNNEK